MFDQTFVDGTGQTSKPYLLFASTMLQAVALGLGILMPILVTQTLPTVNLKSILVAPPAPITARSRPNVSPKRFDVSRLTAPVTIPQKIMTGDVVGAAPDVAGLSPGGDNVLSNPMPLGSAGSDAAPTPQPPPSEKAPHKGPTHIGGQVAEANIIRRIDPVYPQVARQARIQGAVEFTAAISKEGRVEKLQLVRGHPLLVGAAREAILQWRYRPTLLNGQPTEVLTSITVNFILGQ